MSLQARSGGAPAVSEPEIVGRYAIYGEIASGGMATVHLGRLLGEGGFARTVAIKRLHPQFAKDPEFVNMFLDEARIAARIRHPNVVSTLDVVSSGDALLLVMDYVHGESMAKLVRMAAAAGEYVPVDVACGIVSQALLGLQAAHMAKTERGEPLSIIHRDVSPQNIMVGVDGVSQVLDFGVAKAAMRVSTTREGQIKGKIAYMAPEQFGSGEMDHRVDVFACGVVLWEALAGRRLFAGQDVAETLGRIASGKVEPPSNLRPEIGTVLDAVVLKALAHTPEARYASALDFAVALENTVGVASPRAIGAWVERVAAQGLGARSEHLNEVESRSSIVPKSGVGSYSDAGARSSAEAAGAVSTSGLGSTSGFGPGSEPIPHGLPHAASPVRKLLALAAAGLGGAVLVLLALLLFRAPAEQAVDGDPAGGQAAPATEPPAAAPAATTTADKGGTPSAAEAAAPTLHDAPAAEPEQPEPAASPAAASPAAASPAAKPRSVPRAAAKPAKPKAASCDPPYTIDAQGIKRIKPGCL